ncbi:hypothetical protein T440DRAFT_497430 [Plenodomus tracheiphilus IPT5]|uniref:Pyridoxal phosphate homeostasis protein n=1 Tax=Plenodomus tracheiphilus IPT5 TaxID=1408161 RepID=A0A6A7BE03_9PLEO|nr:hypothetical protein T440DRAFT_497430 [Plenodomus tracheiphilus IPT5]
MYAFSPLNYDIFSTPNPPLPVLPCNPCYLISTPMGVIEFLCDRRFHRTFVLPPNLNTDRPGSYRTSYADYGDAESNAVVLFCGALMGTRFCYSPLDQLAKAFNVRIIHPDRPGIGEMVPRLLAHLNISHVSLASHSGGDIYLINTILTYPNLLHPVSPYICFFAPWVHPSHSKVTHLRATELLPAPMIGKFASVARFISENIVPLAGTGEMFLHNVKGTLRRASNTPAPVPLAATTSRSRTPSKSSRRPLINLNDPQVVEELRRQITSFVFAESSEGISADARLFMKKPRTVSWCSPSLLWDDIDYAVPLLSKIISEDDRLIGSSRICVIDTFHAEEDNMVGERGKQWFDECWSLTPGAKFSVRHAAAPVASAQSPKSYTYRSMTVPGTEHNLLMDPSFGASELWLQRVRESFPVLSKVEFAEGATSISTASHSDDKKRKFRFFIGRLKHVTRGVTSQGPLPRSGLSQSSLIVSSRSEMQINPQRAKQLTENITSITSRINAASKGNKQVRLIAVSKLKPANDILALHQPPHQPLQTHFGENYIQELLEKSKLLPPTIHWHMIGGLQSNKCKTLAEQIPNLFCVSSVDSAKKANELEKGRKALLEWNKDAQILRVKVQVNTSGEESKSGVEPEDTLALCKHVVDACPHLQLTGLMTIGAIARSKETTAENENEDFERLRGVREEVARQLGWGLERLELSMGMSADFEGAVGQGSDEVRVGSQIFGERPQRKDAVVKEQVAEEKS